MEEDFIQKMIQLRVMTAPLVMFAQVKQFLEVQSIQLKEVTNVQSVPTVPKAALGLCNVLWVLTQNNQELKVFKNVCLAKKIGTTTFQVRLVAKNVVPLHSAMSVQILVFVWELTETLSRV
jgi:hypothetical protein